MEKVLMVEGMSCGHCVMSVKKALSEVEGVGAVDVDLESGRVKVVGEVLADDALKAAVEDAGYDVASIE